MVVCHNLLAEQFCVIVKTLVAIIAIAIMNMAIIVNSVSTKAGALALIYGKPLLI